MQVKKYLLVILTTSITISIIIPYSYAEEQMTTGSPEIIITRTEEIRKINQLRSSEQKAAFQEQMKLKREEIIREVEDKVKTKNESFQASREAFMKKMKTIRDENKQMLLEKLDTMIREVNNKQTESLSSAIDKLSGILDEMDQKATLTKASGANTTSFDTKMTAARLSISDAKSAIASQAAKEYTINIVSEEALRATVGETRKQLEMDLKVTRESVKKAKDAVREVAKELVKIRKEVKTSVTPTTVISPSSTP